MSDSFQQLKTFIGDNFASAMFLLVVGLIAFAFIGYLLLDYFRTQLANFRIRRRHRREHAHHHS